MSSATSRPFCLGLNVLNGEINIFLGKMLVAQGNFPEVSSICFQDYVWMAINLHGQYMDRLR